jgi:uncharacterized protein
MIVAVSGSTGFVGQALLRKLRERSCTIRMIDRNAFQKTDGEFLDEYIEGCDAVINLAGAPVARKWTEAWKQEILGSRVMATAKIATAINNAITKPKVFISSSAIGIYNSTNTHTESSMAYSGSFLAKVCQEWENEARRTELSTRLVIFRTGMVLGSDGGALKKMHLPFSIGLGGKTGNGKQAVSFIHIDDLAEAMLFTIDNPAIVGIVNAVTPYPTCNSEFSDRLAKVLGQPCWVTIPGFVLRLLYGDGAQVMLDGQTVLPEKLEQAGFRFKYPTIQNALVKIYG